MFSTNLERLDPNIYSCVQEELLRQRSQLQLIASENFASRAVLEAQGLI